MSKSNMLATKDQFTGAVNRVLATDSVSREVIQGCVQASGLDAVNPKYLKKLLLSTGKDFREAGRLGRLEATILLGLALFGDGFLKQMERAKLFLSDTDTFRKTAKSLSEFDRKLAMRGDEWSALRARLATYAAYVVLLQATADRLRWLTRQAGNPIRFWASRLIALAELRFLNAYFNTSVSEQHATWFQSFESPEDFAESVSSVLAIANDRRELDAVDFSYPATDGLTDPHLFELLRAGRMVNHVKDVEKRISLFQYCLRTEDDNGVTVWVLSPPSPEFELTLRLGYVRAEVGRSKIPLDLSQGSNQTTLTMPGMAERFVGTAKKSLSTVRGHRHQI